MGIQELNKFIKEYAPSAMGVISCSEFNGCRIAVDANGWLQANAFVIKSKLNKYYDEIPEDILIKEIILAAVRFSKKLMMGNITPVFVFDGKPPEDKDETSKKRREKVELAKSKIEEIKTEISSGDLSRSGQVAAYSQKITVTRDVISIVATVIRSLGVPSYFSSCEAERLCSMMCLQGYVSAVYSIDTDNIAHKCPLLLTRFSKEHKNMFEFVYYPEIMACIGISHESFLDFCIMCGCDYNTRIYGIGVVKAWDLIKLHKNIEGVRDNGGKDVTVLNHIKSRENFAIIDYHTIIEEIVPYEAMIVMDTYSITSDAIDVVSLAEKTVPHSSGRRVYPTLKLNL
jgi:flap endonuclease-1